MQTDQSSGFRPEIQALRALAVLLVLVYHLWPVNFPGGFVGVDMFFVISGFLITGNMVREAETTGHLSLNRFWAARVRRILPASLVATAITVIAAMFLMPMSWFERIKDEALASVCYVQNWLLAGDSVDYLAANNEPSPFQHYWSLGVEEQFYLLWPLLVLAGVWIAGRTTRRVGSAPSTAVLVCGPTGASRNLRKVLLPIFAVLVLASLAYSVWMTNIEPNPSSYFSTLTRLWELGAGALLALVPRAWQLPVPLRSTCLIACFAGAIATALLLTPAIPFPGLASIIPAVLAALGLLTGPVPTKLGLKAFTQFRPIQFVGNISYSLYLWHFPPVVLFTVSQGQAPDVLQGLGLASVSLVLATASYFFVENPIRASWLKTRPMVSLLGAAVAMAIVAGVACIPPIQASSTKERWSQAEILITPGPGQPYGAPFFVTSKSQTLWVNPDDHAIAPSPLGKLDSTAWPGYGGKCSHLPSSLVALECEYLPPTSKVTKTIVLVGDSMVEQQIPALIPLAEKYGYRFVSFLHNGCPFSKERLTSEITSDSKCSIANADTLPKILELKPAMVITSAFLDIDFVPTDTDEVPGVVGTVEMWDVLADAGIPILAIRNTPRAGPAFVDCMVKNYSNPTACDLPRDAAVKTRETAFWDRMKELRPKAHYLDLLPYLCREDICPAVIGNVMPYRNRNHMTIEFSKSLSDVFAESIEEALADVS